MVLITAIFLVKYFIHWWHGESPNPITWTSTASGIWDRFTSIFSTSEIPIIFQVFFLFAANMLLFMGPLLAMGIMQIKAFEPGDAEWGVKLDDVRGQPEAKEDIRRVVTLWQSGEVFEKSGGKRERGLLFLGAPGTGKTMMAKAIATSFNSPFVTIPGSGFAQAFIGIDAIVVRVMAARAKRLARKWGGTCIVFIDEIDAVGMRRQSLGGARMGEAQMNPLDDMTPTFYGPRGALNSTGDVIVESAAWREHMFRMRAPEPRAPYPGWYTKLSGIVNQGIFPGMMGGGGLALNQLLVVMDGVDNPPFFKRFRTNRMNTILDAIYILPRRYGKRSGLIFSSIVGVVGAFFLVNSTHRRLQRHRPGAVAGPELASLGARDRSDRRVGDLVRVQRLPRLARQRHALAPRQAGKAARKPGLLHRRDQRPGRRARPGAHARRAHGPPHHLPHADEG